MQEYLNKAEKAAVMSFIGNKTMSEAVKKVVMHTITHQGVLEAGKPAVEANWVFGLAAGSMNHVTNEQLGEELKATLKGLSYLQEGFKKLYEVSVPAPKESKVNPAL
jgi:hypothetical protein